MGGSPAPPGASLAPGHFSSSTSLSLGLCWLPGSHGAGGGERQEGEWVLTPPCPLCVPHVSPTCLPCVPHVSPMWPHVLCLHPTERVQPRGRSPSLSHMLAHVPSPRGARGLLGDCPTGCSSHHPPLSPQGKAGQTGQTGQRGPPVSNTAGDSMSGPVPPSPSRETPWGQPLASHPAPTPIPAP